ncbi:hypothetical protein ACWCXB_01620 [Streptomyces sp. NPDC001514]
MKDIVEALDPVNAVAEENEKRLLHLREDGPTPYAFTLRTSFPPGVE